MISVGSFRSVASGSVCIVAALLNALRKVLTSGFHQYHLDYEREFDSSAPSRDNGITHGPVLLVADDERLNARGVCHCFCCLALNLLSWMTKIFYFFCKRACTCGQVLVYRIWKAGRKEETRLVPGVTATV